ncbi:hypothetical protein D9758_008788 [Tetrapyrgos nigripes]|uniref:DUF2828 domain-containing protein n=1 Tax=Tetrapyrgos nigripes TaxID=182062 RepID=A0A8H5D3T0_9AGAR|nr:hypothetical protein D9758_008788 [Tetrapyrgos nigripes]
MSSGVALEATTQEISLPHIPELYDPNFLDLLLPPPKEVNVEMKDDTTIPRNAMMEALQANTTRTFTQNGALAFNSTGSPTLDAFNALTAKTSSRDIAYHLRKSWAEDPSLTLRLIWQLRSIHEGKGETEAFYRRVLPPSSHGFAFC